MDFQSYMAALQQQYPNKIGIRTIEIQMGNANGRYVLPDDDILRECQIFGFFTTDNANSNEIAPDSGRALALPATIVNSYLTLLCGSLEVVTQHPLKQMAVSSSDRSILPLQIHGVTTTKSFIRIANTGSVDPSGKSILLSFVYLNE